jgi:hypothetical protein
LGKAIQHDYVKGSREINLDLTLLEAEFLFTASDKIKAMAASGELQKLHKKCDSLEVSVDTAYTKTMELLNRTELQINQAENDIVEDYAESDKIQMHEEGLNDRDSCIAVDNFKRLERKLGHNDGTVSRLRDLLTARAELLQAKVDVQHDYVSRIIGDEPLAVDELQNFKDSLKDLDGLHGSSENLQGDGKMLYEQV